MTNTPTRTHLFDGTCRERGPCAEFAPVVYLACTGCGRRFAEGIATAKPSADMPDVCTDCREGIDA